MLGIKVSVPGLGEPTPLDSDQPLLGEEKSVRVVFSDGGEAQSAVQMPARRAMKLAADLHAAARRADPEGTSFGAILRDAVKGNA
jgi:hypothetical protein